MIALKQERELLDELDGKLRIPHPAVAYEAAVDRKGVFPARFFAVRLTALTTRHEAPFLMVVIWRLGHECTGRCCI